MISLQTNVDSMLAQSNLSVDNKFQSNTIQQLTSGYKINSSGDNAAGLAIANGYRNNIAELTQGVSNANDGVSQLQIIDGGMNNISTILDRLNTLATQSASGTFTGNRGVLNSEFQSLVQEVDRQAQAIGLNTGGQFNKSLSVFIGGGAGSSSSAIVANGSINVDLSKAQVDTQSLGLKGVQAVNSTSYDLSASSSTSVSKIIADAGNQLSAGGKQATFTLFGAGYSNAAGNNSGLAVTVNLNGVSDTNSLVAAINNAIQSVANGPTGADAQFKAANVSASVVTNASGQQMLAFNSSESAFQVTGSDQMANALLGNFSTGVTGAQGSNYQSAAGSVNLTSGLDTSTNAIQLTFANTASSGGVGGTGTASIMLNSNDTTAQAVVDDINAQIAANGSLANSGITASVDGTGHLIIQSNKGAITTTETDSASTTKLGLAGAATSLLATPSTAAVSNTSLASGLDTSGANGITLSFTGGGVSGTHSITINSADGSAAALATDINTLIAGDVNLANTGIAASIVGGKLQISSTQGAVTIAESNAGSKDLGFGAGTTTAFNVDASGGNSITLTLKNLASGSGGITGLGSYNITLSQKYADVNAIAADINSQIAANSNLQAAGLNASVVNGKIQILGTQGAIDISETDTTATSASLGLSSTATANTAATANATATFTAGQTYSANGSSELGTSGTASDVTFTALSSGNTQAITVSANDASGNAHALTISLTHTNASNLNDALAALNDTLQQSGDSTLKQITAVAQNDSGTLKINFVSTLPNFSVSLGSAPSGQGLAAASGGDTNHQATTLASTQVGSGGTADISTQAGAQAAVTALTAAVQMLGNAQAAVGRSQNQLNYAQGLAQSQITNFSAAESRIRDTDVASAAANLTKSQVLTQTAIAAMAQANSEAQSVMKLLQ